MWTALSFWFLHPWLAAAALPIGAAAVLVHLLQRRRQRPLRWAAMQFLEAAVAQSRRRARLERWLLILLRTAMLVLLAMLVARPLLGAAGLAGGADRDGALLVVLDNGLAMQAVGQGESGSAAVEAVEHAPFARAVEAALSMIREWRGPVAVRPALPGSGSEATWFARADLAEAALGRIVPTAGRADWPPVLAGLPDLLAGSMAPGERRTVVILTSLTRGNWAAQDRWQAALAPLTEAAARVVLVDIEPALRANATPSDLRVEAAFAGRDLPVLARAAIANHASGPVTGLRVVWTVDGREVRQDVLPSLDAGSRHEVLAELPPLAPGAHHVAVRLAGGADALPADDQRWAHVAVPGQWRIVLVEPNIAAAPADRASLFVAAALESAASQSAAPIRVEVVAPTQLQAALARPADAVLLVDVPAPMARDWRQIADHVQRGGGLLVWLGSRADPAAYRTPEAMAVLPAAPQTLATAPGRDGWPVVLASPVPAALADLVDQAAEERGHPLGLVQRVARLQPAAGAQVLAQTAGGPAAIVAANAGRGTAVVIAASPDLAWGNMASRPVFPALVLDLLRMAMADPSADRQVACGQAIAVPLATASLRDASWIAPDGRSVPAELSVDQGRAQAVLPLAAEPGPYHLQAGGQAEMLVANADPVAGDLAELPAAQRRLLEEAGVRITGEAAASQTLARASLHEWSAPMAGALMVLALLEIVLTGYFTRAREP